MTVRHCFISTQGVTSRRILVSLVWLAIVGFLFYSIGTVKVGRDLPPRHVFVDVGGNVGDSVAAFINKGVPGVARAGQAFDAIYVFEPNPTFATRYDRYRNKNYMFDFIPAAAAARDGILTFAGADLGGSTLSKNSDHSVSIRSVDFSAWLKRSVSLDDFVVCKIDAEGSEYEIVQQMFVDGTLCLCDRLSIEWHGWLGVSSDSDSNAHVRSFLDPNALTERFDSPACGAECFCSIPHLKQKLPYFYCGLPFTVKWARAACNLPQGTPVLEHHESWKGWEFVGSPDAFERYPLV